MAPLLQPQTAQGAEGTLQDQADIYAESWEAANKRVKAAAQGIYQDLLDDKFFINMANGFEKILEAVKGFINGLGGMKGVLMTVGSIFLNTYAQKMPEALNSLRQNFMVLTGQATKLMIETQQKTQKYLNTIKNDGSGTYSLAFKTQAEGLAKVNEMQQRLILNSKNMTEQEKQSYQLQIQKVQMMYEESNAIAKEVEEVLGIDNSTLIGVCDSEIDYSYFGVYNATQVESINTSIIGESNSGISYVLYYEAETYVV